MRDPRRASPYMDTCIPTLSRLPFRPDIQALRALAIFVVVGYHVGVPGLTGGYVGVDVFFVVSGYLITHLVSGSLSRGNFSLTNFYARRVRRLLPAASLVTLTTLGVAYLLLSPLETERYGTTAQSVALYFSNVEFARDATDYLAAEGGDNPFLHTWSLAVEEQFYLVWPIALLVASASAGRRFLGRRSGEILLIGIFTVSFVLCVELTASREPLAFFLTPARGWEFAAGGLLSMLHTSHRPSRPSGEISTLLGVCLIALATLALDSATQFPGYAALIPVAGTLAVLHGGAGGRQHRLSPALRLAPVQRLGDASYSWYLWHWPALVIALAIEPELSWPALTLIAGVALVASLLTLVLLENPLRHSNYLRKRDGIVLGGGLVTTAAVFAAALSLTHLSSRQLDEPGQQVLQTAISTKPGHERDGCNAGFFASAPMTPCAYGSKSSRRSLMLIGDSHAGQIFPALNPLARHMERRLIVRTKSNCLPVDVSFSLERLGREYFECETWRDEVLSEILEIQPDLVILAFSHGQVHEQPNGFGITTEELLLGAHQTVELLDGASIPHLVLQDTPRPNTHVPECLSRRLANSPIAQSCRFEVDAGLNEPARQAVRTAWKDSTWGQSADLTRSICPVDPCPVVTPSGFPVYRDTNHLSVRFAKSLSRDFLSLVTKVGVRNSRQPEGGD